MTEQPRFSDVALGVILVLMGLFSLLVNQNPVLFFIMLAALYYMFQRMRSNNAEQDTTATRSGRNRTVQIPQYDAAQPEQSGKDRIYGHALDAIAEAGLDPETVRVLPTDIGVLTFKDRQEPVVHRTRDLPDDVDYLQPFVQLRLPVKAQGRIRFEIIDRDGQMLFIHEDDQVFKRGHNLIMPGSRLPIHDAHALYGDWELRVSADNMLLAVHRFAWVESATRQVRRHLTEDGEISNALRAAMAENRLGSLSLDDLLDEQGDIIEERGPRQQHL
jgi:hypothetical protein